MQLRLITLSITILFSIIGCTKQAVPEQKGTAAQSSVSFSDNFIDLKQIKAYADKVFPVTKSEERVDYSIKSMRSSDGDTVAYLLNSQGHGWKIVSADARTPAILAEDSHGSFSLEEGSPALAAWIDCMKRDMAAIRRARDDQLNFSAQEIAINKAFWTGEPLRDPLPIDVPEPGDGHWVTTTTAETEVYETKGHMVPKWDQGHPYNSYCPLRTDTIGVRAPAGCVAVAGAQMLYFLHDTLGIPPQMYSQGECSGYVNNYHQSFWDETTTIWASMDTSNHFSGANAEALMIGYVGSRIDMHYGNNGSTGLHFRLRNRVFSDYGISSSLGNYDSATVKNSLDNGFPVIVAASPAIISSDGHCFVIDGYQKTRIKYTHCTHWEPDEPLSWYDHTQYPTTYTYSYSTPQITSIQINWGWWTQWRYTNPLNNGWFSLTGDWLVEYDEGSPDNYIYNRTMIYNFSVSN